MKMDQNDKNPKHRRTKSLNKNTKSKGKKKKKKKKKILNPHGPASWWRSCHFPRQVGRKSQITYINFLTERKERGGGVVK